MKAARTTSALFLLILELELSRLRTPVPTLPQVELVAEPLLQLGQATARLRL